MAILVKGPSKLSPDSIAESRHVLALQDLLLAGLNST